MKTESLLLTKKRVLITACFKNLLGERVLLLHIIISRSFCVNQDSVVLNILSQGDGDGGAVRIWIRESRKCLFVFVCVHTSI